MKLKTGRGERVYGPDLMKKLLNSKTKIKQAFLGNEKNKKYFEKLGKYIVLPFKDEFEESDYKKMVEKIKSSKAKVIWVGLGAKKTNCGG